MLTAKMNCAGQRCEDRGACRRYQIRIVDSKTMRGEIETKNYAWASFDIEREQHAGPCSSFIQNREFS
jgi:hypothetical protein